MLAWMDHKEHGYVVYAQSGSVKCLELKLTGGYRVTHKKKTVYEGTDGKTAVAAYNEICD
jgi:hypothetical protein